MLSDLWMRVRALFRRRVVEAELDDELRFHLERQIEKHVRGGITREEARRRARVELGGVEQTKEECREARGVKLFEVFFRDLRHGLRQLRRNPTFTVIAVLTLGLGIGVNTAIFSVVDWMLLRSLPVGDPSQITLLAYQQKGGSIDTEFSYPEFEELQRQTSSVFSDVIGYDEDLEGLAVDGAASQISVVYITADFFQTLGLKPALGRLIQPEEGKTASANPVLVLSYSFWETHFGGDRAIVGKQASVNGHAVTIIGVAPEGFRGIDAVIDIQGYLPLGMRAVEGGQGDFKTNWNDRSLALLGRLRAGASLTQAGAVLKVVDQRLASRNPRTEAGISLLAYPEWEARAGPDPDHTTQKISALFLTLAGLVLLLACVNVANLLLVRTMGRDREMAVRAALGAGRGRLVGQLLTEGVLLALLGGFAGLWLGVWGIRILRSVPLHTNLPLHFAIGLDWRVVCYALAAAIATGIVVGIAPALRASRANLNAVLHEGGRAGSSRRHWLRSALAAAQVAGSLTLLVAAGLFTRSLAKAESGDLGFDPAHVVNVSMNPKGAGYNEAQTRAFYRQLLERVRAMPGVISASIAFSVPMGYFSEGTTFEIEGQPTQPGVAPPASSYNSVTPGYFETLRIPIVRGRGFTEADDQNAQPVAIVNEAMARRFWPHEDAIGKAFTMANGRRRTVRIVGVAGNSRTRGLTGPFQPYFYVPVAQDYAPLETLQVRTAEAPATMIREIEGEIRTLGPAVPVFDTQTMRKALDTWHGFLLFRLAAGLAGALGALGLVLALVGVYGVMAYSTSQRTREIGIRMALGAEAGDVLRTILRQGLTIVGAGMAAGLAASFAVSRLVGNFLVGVSATDPMTYGIVCGAMAVVAIGACYIPTRRGMRVDPVVALRHE